MPYSVSRLLTYVAAYPIGRLYSLSTYWRLNGSRALSAYIGRLSDDTKHLATFGFVRCLRQKRKLMSFVSSVAFYYSYDKIVSDTSVYSTQAVIGEAYFS